MNISVPDELRQRMQPLDKTLNWSALATIAFRKAVDNADYLSSIKSDVKRRIVATEIEDIGGVEEFARQRGREWAAAHARMIELRQLAKYVDAKGIDFSKWETVVRIVLGHEF